MTDLDSDLDQYRTARQLILERGAASPAWLQRQLGLTSYEAVRLIERMQDDGLVSAPDSQGRREIFIVEEGDAR